MMEKLVFGFTTVYGALLTVLALGCLPGERELFGPLLQVAFCAALMMLGMAGMMGLRPW